MLLTGKVSLQQFTDRQNRIELEGHFAQSYRINQLRYTYFLTRDPEKRREVVERFHSLVSDIIGDPTASNVFKLYAKAMLLETEGLDATAGLFLRVAEATLSIQLGRQADIPRMFELYSDRLNEWATNIESVVNEASELGHDRILATAILTQVLIQFHHLVSVFSLNKLLNKPPPEIPEATVQHNIQQVEKSIEIFLRVGDLEGELRGKLIVADFYEFVGDDARAKEIAAEVLPKAEAMAYVRQIEHARDHLASRGLRARLASTQRERSEEEKLVANADFSNDKVREYATQMLRILQLPPERLPNLEYEYLSIRRIAQEKLTWCRHIDLLQDLSHSRSPVTHFRQNPNRVCVCNLLKHKSKLEHPNWETVISAFKKNLLRGMRRT